MTDKQEKILNAALELFAMEGYKGTSTSKVAKEANVSEGLIFRHFKNKEGLLEAILKLGEERASTLFAEIVTESNPKEVIKKALELAMKTSLDESEANFWKLQYKIKWELEMYGAHKMEPLKVALVNAFTKLKYHNPEQNAEAILAVMDGMATRFFLDPTFDMKSLVNHLKTIYKV